MNLCFYKDGTFSKEKINNKKELEFKCIDISTQRKGPIVTFTKKSNFKGGKAIQMEINMNYGAIDIPFDAETNFNSILEIDTPNHAYNVYPLIKQLISCNSFIDNQSLSTDSKIYIDKIHLISNKDDYTITEDTSDKTIDMIFNHIGIKTCMNEIIKPDFCIITSSNGCWKNIEFENICMYNNTNLDTIFIPLSDMETAYKCNYKLYLRLKKIKYVSVKISYIPKSTDFGINYLNSSDGLYENEYMASGINEILQLCLFVPQIIYIEQSLYKMDATIKLNVIENNRNIELIITEKESKFDINTGFFNLIKRIITITS